MHPSGIHKTIKIVPSPSIRTSPEPQAAYGLSVLLAEQYQLEIQFERRKMDKSGIDNFIRKHTIFLKYPRDGRYSAALRRRAFAKFVYGWIELMRDCYILHVSAL